MTDMSPVIVPKSDQVNSDDLIAGPLTITIRDVQIKGGQEQPVSVYFEGSDKAFRPCKSMARVMVAVWGADSKQYLGRSLTLYRDASVKWAGVEVGGIRISHMSHMDGPMTMALTATKGSRKPYTVHPLQTQGTAALTIEAARAAVVNAATLADLETVWRGKAMSPFRDALADTLAEAKATFAARAAPSLLEQLQDRLTMADDVATVDDVQAEFDAREGEIPLADRPTLQNEISASKERILKGEA